MSKRPYWQAADCPSWCHGVHRKSDHADDRRHTSRWDRRFRLSLLDPVCVDLTGNGGKMFFEPREALVYVEQGDREVEPRVILAEERRMFDNVDLTLAEARKLIEALRHALDLGEGHCST